MNRTIIRHVLPPAAGEVSIQVSQGAEVLAFNEDPLSRPSVYVAVDLDRPTVWRRLHVYALAGSADRQPLPDGCLKANVVGALSTKAGAELVLFDLGER